MRAPTSQPSRAPSARKSAGGWTGGWGGGWVSKLIEGDYMGLSQNYALPQNGFPNMISIEQHQHMVPFEKKTDWYLVLWCSYKGQHSTFVTVGAPLPYVGQ